MSFMASWFVTTIACAVAIWLVPGITAVGGSIVGPAVFALALAIINASIKPVLQLLNAPFTIITLGIGYICVNALLLELASFLSRNIFHAGVTINSFGAAFVGAIVISLVSMFVGSVTGLDADKDDR